MRNLWYFLKKLQNVIGLKLYFSMILTIVISGLEGIGIYLLVPMLAIIGLINLNIDEVFPISLLVNLLKQLPFQLNLPFILILYFILIAGQAILQRTQTIMNTDIQQTFIRTLRMETYQSLIGSRWEFFLSKRKSDFNYILTTEISRVGSGTYSLITLSSTIFFTLVQISLAFLLSPVLTIIVLISGVLLSIFMKTFISRSKKLGEETSELMNEYFGGITEQFNGIKDMKSNMLESSYYQWFEKLSFKLHTNIMQLVKLSSSSKLVYRVGAALIIICFVYIALTFLHVSPEKMIIVILIFSRLWPKFSSIQSSIEQIVSMFSAFDRVIKINKDSKRNQELDPIFLKDHDLQSQMSNIRMEKEIECRNIAFRYHPEGWALSHINIHIPINKTTAIVGQSGAGKTTLVDIVMGLLKPELGNVYIDGHLLAGQDLFAYRNVISYVSQDPFLYHNSIRENLVMVRQEATENELWDALRFAAADDLVRKLPNGLDTVIGDRGIKLSGGERQRIVLARAILRKPSVLVLDEATSALDSENEMKIQQAIERLKGTMTIIVIAHRLSTIRNADHVIVLHEGNIIEQGSYQLLSERKGAFRKMLTKQVSWNSKFH